MNIFKRIANWLIKKLGGYTANIVESKNEAIRYYYGLYKTEHENYLAMLNCHNATAEAKMDALTMARGIKAYCASRDDCEGCELHDTGHCKLSYGRSCPEYWEVDE